MDKGNRNHNTDREYFCQVYLAFKGSDTFVLLPNGTKRIVKDLATTTGVSWLELNPVQQEALIKTAMINRYRNATNDNITIGDFRVTGSGDNRSTSPAHLPEDERFHPLT